MKWLEKNWWKLLIIPLVAIFLYRFFKVIASVVLRSPPGPDLSSSENRERDEMSKAESYLNVMIKDLQLDLKSDKNDIDCGKITPAEVFNKELKK